MSDTKWCVIVGRGRAVYGPYDDMKAAYESISEDTSMQKVDVKPMRDGGVDL